jgi:hypothetical protein
VLQRRLWRFLPDRSQLMLLAGVLIVLFGAVSFVNLAIAKSAALAKERSVQVQLEQARQQNARLQRALQQAQAGQNVMPKAYEYFGMTLPGVTMVLPETPEDTTVGPVWQEPPPAEPIWLQWWERFRNP